MKHQSIYNRLRRIEGQIRGIEEMISKDRDSEDILIQLEAVRASLASSISALIESMLEKNLEGNIILSEKEKNALLRAIKK